MSTTVLMKILESAPGRYDRGIRLLTLGEADRAYDWLASRVEKGQRVLDIGCGTGALTLRAAQRGAHVVGIDKNAQMLDIARQRVNALHGEVDVELREMGVVELDGEAAESYDVVMAGLCFSELTDGERAFAVCQSYRLLKPCGLLLVADEVVPRSVLKRLFHWCVRLPLTLVTYLLTQTTTHPLDRLPERIEAGGVTVESKRMNGLESFLALVARKPETASRCDLALNGKQKGLRAKPAG
jgi:ubiquinone/menaquinone biosynthesis C-methylase UbiE